MIKFAILKLDLRDSDPEPEIYIKGMTSMHKVALRQRLRVIAASLNLTAEETVTYKYDIKE